MRGLFVSTDRGCMKRFYSIMFASSLSMTALIAGAVSDGQYQAIKALGELNGVALQCGYISETRRMKGAMIVVLPKRRALGEAFDIVTNEAYLRFIERGAVCPDAKRFELEVDGAIEALHSVFPH